MTLSTDPSVFWNRLNKQGPIPAHVPELGACWEWTGQVFANGRGVMKWTRRFGEEKAYVHRISWILTYGDIPDSLHVLHKCDNGLCCRPDHLFLGTHLDNMRDRDMKGRGNISRGEAHPSAVLTEDQVRAIRYQYDTEGISLSDIARQRGLHTAHVWKIVHRKKWTHIA